MDGLGIVADGADKVVLFVAQFAPIEIGVGIAGIHFQRVIEIGDGLVVLPQRGVADAAIVEVAPLGVVERHGRIEILQGFLLPVGLGPHFAAAIVRPGHQPPGVNGHGAVEPHFESSVALVRGSR